MKTFLRIIELFGSLSSISAWVFAYVQWQGEQRTLTLIAIGTGFLLLLIAVVARFSERKVSASHKKSDFEVLSDEMSVKAIGYRRMIGPPDPDANHSVHYPRLFKHLPNLKIECTKGRSRITVLDERTDGFKFRVTESRPLKGKIRIKWTATGDLIQKQR